MRFFFVYVLFHSEDENSYPVFDFSPDSPLDPDFDPGPGFDDNIEKPEKE